MADNPNQSPAQKLINILSFDPTKEPRPSGDVLKNVLAKLKEEQSKKAEAAAEVQLRKAIELQTSFTKVSRDFENAKKKFEKELGGIIRQIEAALAGKEVPPEQEETPPAAS
jgi:hypothetical protein